MFEIAGYQRAMTLEAIIFLFVVNFALWYLVEWWTK